MSRKDDYAHKELLKAERSEIEEQLADLRARYQELDRRLKAVDHVRCIHQGTMLTDLVEEVGNDFLTVRTIPEEGEVQYRMAKCYYSRRKTDAKNPPWMVTVTRCDGSWPLSSGKTLGLDKNWTQAQARQVALTWLLYGSYLTEFEPPPDES